MINKLLQAGNNIHISNSIHLLLFDITLTIIVYGGYNLPDMVNTIPKLIPQIQPDNNIQKPMHVLIGNLAAKVNEITDKHIDQFNKRIYIIDIG